MAGVSAEPLHLRQRKILVQVSQPLLRGGNLLDLNGLHPPSAKANAIFIAKMALPPMEALGDEVTEFKPNLSIALPRELLVDHYQSQPSSSVTPC